MPCVLTREPWDVEDWVSDAGGNDVDDDDDDDGDGVLSSSLQ